MAFDFADAIDLIGRGVANTPAGEPATRVALMGNNACRGSSSLSRCLPLRLDDDRLGVRLMLNVAVVDDVVDAVVELNDLSMRAVNIEVLRLAIDKTTGVNPRRSSWLWRQAAISYGRYL